MIPSPLLTLRDVEELLIEGRTEDRTIEYKLSLPGNAETEKVPWFLKPVCSFANTDGGDLLFGVKAEDGVPKEVVGVDIVNVDQVKLTLEHFLQNSIEPQVRGIGIREVRLSNGKHVLIVRVPRSWTSPHRVKTNARFYARNNAGAYELDIPQIRQAFLLSATVADRIQSFRVNRIAAIAGASGPVPFKEGLRLILHVLPLSSFTSAEALPVSQYEELWKRLVPPVGGNTDYHFNLDGIVVATTTRDDAGFVAYSQFFRSGVIEFVRIYESRGEDRYVPSIEFEKTMIQNLENGLAVIRDLAFSHLRIWRYPWQTLAGTA
jgi:hypothetical protein